MNKKNLLLFVIFFLISSLLGAKGKKVILVNPAKSDLHTINELIKNNIIDVDSPEFIAVYYDKSENSASGAEEFIKDNDVPYLTMRVLEGELNADNIYRENDLSEKFRELFAESSAILFFGGADIQPELYGKKNHLLTAVRTPNRHLFELSFIFHLLGGSQDENFAPLLEEKPDYPVYGFCLGMQTMNAATGGTLYQDIPTEIYGIQYAEDLVHLGPELMHKNYWRTAVRDDDDFSHRAYHPVVFNKGQYFVTEQKENKDYRPVVISHHHQAVEKTGKGFVVAATSVDGKVIEAIEHEKYPNVLGVQFHPEVWSIYVPGNSFKYSSPEETLTTENEMMKQKKSLSFHINFWKHFSNLVNGVN